MPLSSPKILIGGRILCSSIAAASGGAATYYLSADADGNINRIDCRSPYLFARSLGLALCLIGYRGKSGRPRSAIPQAKAPT